MRGCGSTIPPDILHVGSGGAPANSTIDPDILGFCELERRILVTKNRKSMPGHIADYVRDGHEFWGLLTIKRGREHDIGGLVESLILIWETQEAEDYLGVQTWIPL